MHIVAEFDLVDVGGLKARPEMTEALAEVRRAVEGLVWPTGSDRFTIYPQSGKRSGEGNGVRPIRDAFVLQLEEQGWRSEVRFPVATPSTMANFGNMDAAKPVDGKPFIVEWETGNISSSHRAMNKMSVGLIEQAITAGVLILPSKKLAKYLTDRIGNVWELEPYFPVWSSLDVANGYLGVIVVEHDAESFEIDKIRKGTDGRALR